MSDQSTEHNDLPGGQLSLLPDTVTDEVLHQSELARGICSGVQLKTSDPDRYMTVCALLADGSMSQRQISRLTGTSRNLVSAINRQAVEIEPLKQQIASRARNLGQLCLERAEEIVQSGAKVTLRDLAILAGVAIDKSQLLTGEATQRVEQVAAAPGHDDFADELRQLRQADVHELPATGSGGGKSGAKGELVEPREGAGCAVEVAADGAAADVLGGGGNDA